MTRRRSRTSIELGGFAGTHAIGHVRMATESDVDISGAHPVLGVSVLRRRGRAQRPADELLPVEAAARIQRASVPVRMRLRDHRRLPRGEDGRRRLPRGRDAQEPRGPRRRLHVHGGHEGRARRRQGRDGREAAGPVRIRRLGRDGVARRSRSGRSSTARSTPPIRTRGRCSCGHDERAPPHHLRRPRAGGAVRGGPQGLRDRRRHGQRSTRRTSRPGRSTSSSAG